MNSNNTGSTKVSEMAMTATAKEAREEFQCNLSKILEDDPKQTLFQK